LVEKLLQKPDRLILMNILASPLATSVGMRVHCDLRVAIAIGVLTFTILAIRLSITSNLHPLYPEYIRFH
jgi:Mg2+/Co2+ transporter CorB